jgi:predicted transposase YbfD/YdcC
MFIPTLDQINITGKTLTADALLTQKKNAKYLVQRGADYLFTVKANQATLLADIVKFFENRQEPECSTIDSDHGRIDTRSIWTTSELNDYVEFPHVGQVFCIHRKSVDKKSREVSDHIIYGVTSKKSDQADAKKLLEIHRGHWTIENSSHHILDRTYNEDKSTIRTGHGPANTTRLRRFAIGLLKSRGVKDVAQKLRDLHQKARIVFDYLGMTNNSRKVAGG